MSFRDLAIVLGSLSLIFFVLFALTTLSQENPLQLFSYITPNDLNAPTKNSSEPTEITRYVVKKHTIVGGESFSLITGKYWDDIYLWPDLYVLNDIPYGDPDLIYPDEMVDIYNRLGNGDEYTKKEKKLILDAYIQVYDRFKQLGPHKNGSAWTLLWCGVKYDENFLHTYAHRIEPDDLEVVRKYIAEEGFLD